MRREVPPEIAACSTYDCSMDETIHLTMPAFAMAVNMNLSGQNFDGVFTMRESHEIIGFNLKNSEVHGFLFRQSILEKFLNENDLGIFWSILSEKRMLGGYTDKSPGRHDFSSSVILLNGELKEVGRKIGYLPYPRR